MADEAYINQVPRVEDQDNTGGTIRLMGQNQALNVNLVDATGTPIDPDTFQFKALVATDSTSIVDVTLVDSLGNAIDLNTFEFKSVISTDSTAALDVEIVQGTLVSLNNEDILTGATLLLDPSYTPKSVEVFNEGPYQIRLRFNGTSSSTVGVLINPGSGKIVDNLEIDTISIANIGAGTTKVSIEIIY